MSDQRSTADIYVPRGRRAIVWFVAALAGLLAPTFSSLAETPQWLAWVLKGSGGQGQGWWLLGLMSLAAGVIESLAWGAYRYQSRGLDLLAMLLARSLGAFLLLVGAAVVLIGGGFAIAMLLGGLADLLPVSVGSRFKGLEFGRSPLVIGGILAFMMLAMLAVDFGRVRREEPGLDTVWAIGRAAVSAWMPFWLLTMVGLTSFVFVGIMLIAITHWFPGSASGWSTWIDANLRRLNAVGMTLCCLAPVAIHVGRVVRRRDITSTLKFSDSCWPVYWAMLGLGGVVLVLAIVVGLFGKH